MKNDKSICFVTTGDLKNQASAKRALGLANAMSDLGWNVSILMDDTTENRHRVKMECDDRVCVHFNRYISAYDERKRKSMIVQEICPSIIFLCAFVFRNIVKVPKNCIVLSEHSELMSNFDSIKGWHKLRYYIVEYWSILYSDGLINASKYLEKVFRKRAKCLLKGKMPMLYLPYAYNKEVCKIDLNASRVLKKKRDERFILFLGSLTMEYGAMTMVKAFEQIREKNGNLKLLLCGKGPAYHDVMEYIEKHKLQDTIYTPGFVAEEDISAYFTLADAFISPMNDTIQDWARCPSKLYMYLPYKKPIITNRIGEPYEALKEKGVYYKPSDVNSFSDAILELAKNGNWELDINPLDFEWSQRAENLDLWIMNNIMKHNR